MRIARIVAIIAQNEIVIGYQATGNGSNTATWGNTSVTDHFFTGTININDSNTKIWEDGSGNLSFYDDVLGATKTLTQLAAAGGGGASDFDTLSDTPANKTDKAGYVVTVASNETDLEYTTAVQAFDGGAFDSVYTDTVDFNGGAFA